MADSEIDQPCVMVVDADVLVRHPLAEYLRECGYRVLEASDAAEAKALAAHHAPDLEWVLANIELPDATGFELANWLRAHYPDVEVSLAGAIKGAVEKAKDICEEGPSVTRPYDHAQVLDRIKQLIAARRRAQVAAQRKAS